MLPSVASLMGRSVCTTLVMQYVVFSTKFIKIGSGHKEAVIFGQIHKVFGPIVRLLSLGCNILNIDFSNECIS